MVGLLLPAIGKAREQAQITRCASSMRLIATAMTIWAAEHNDQLPPDLGVLVKNDLLTDDFTRSPIGPVDDAKGDYWINFKVKKFSDVRESDRQVLGYDRATYAQGRQVVVVFFDSHVAIMSIEEFDELVKEPPNTGTDFNLPGAD